MGYLSLGTRNIILSSGSSRHLSGSSVAVVRVYGERIAIPELIYAGIEPYTVLKRVQLWCVSLRETLVKEKLTKEPRKM